MFVQVIHGDIAILGQNMSAGDGAQIEGERELEIASRSEAEFLLFDMG